jgi:hypothetical protein
MPEFYLGSNLVSALYLGNQEICTSYLGGTQVYDGCGFTPVVVTLSVTNNIAGPSAGYTIGGDNTGSQRSGEPLVGTYSFNTTVSLNSGYEWVSGPSISNASGTFPASNQTVFTILSGEVQLTATNKTVTLSVVDNVNDPGVSHTLSGDLNGATATGLPGTSYSFTTNLNVNSEWSGTITPSTTQTISGTIPSNNDTVTITFNGTLTQNQYVVNHAYDTSGVTGTQYSSPVSSVTSASSEVISSTGSQVTGYAGATWNFVTSGLIANTGYEWTSGPTLSPTSPRAVSISGGQATPATLTTFVTGTISQAVNQITLGGASRSCANYSCISPGAGSEQSDIWYYAGTLSVGTVLWSNNDLTGSNPTAGFYGILPSLTNSVQYGASAIIGLPSCVNALNPVTLKFGSTPATACAAPTTEAGYIDGFALSTASNFYTDSIGCSFGSNGYYSDGTYVRQLSNGAFISFASC